MKKMLDPMPYTFSVKPRLQPEYTSNESQASLQASDMAKHAREDTHDGRLPLVKLQGCKC